ncbi:metallophosphoesterase [Pectobacterium versatile]|uniref:metallophosphoesterase n=1 Tax=Pectobacterium versatile TaxID=2488639 RepID=UPI001B393CFF|nr:metallophosphoesterase [Pectobacterium versatile]MBQ4768071.1 metallophosphoesterase [Pectobacterium versatile]
MFHLWTLAPALYVSLFFIRRLTLSFARKIGFVVLVIIACEFHLISHLVYGNMFSPEWPRPVMIAQGWLFVSAVLFACLLLFRDVAALLARWLFRCRIPFLPSAMPLLILALGVSAFGVMQAIRVPNVRTVTITIPNLPSAFDGTRIVQLADLHSSRLHPREWVEQVVNKANALQPDLIVLTGDMFDGYVSQRYADVEPLRYLRARDGIYAITGNHEYYFKYRSWMSAWESLNIPFLLNAHVCIERDGQSLVLAGVTDEAAIKEGEVGPDIARALEGTQPSDTIILLDHRPGNALVNARHGVNLQLSGHTHGGMIRGLDIAIKPANNGFISGLYRVGEMSLYVSNGAGLWNGFPVRLGRPAEITHIVLNKG